MTFKPRPLTALLLVALLTIAYLAFRWETIGLGSLELRILTGAVFFGLLMTALWSFLRLSRHLAFDQASRARPRAALGLLTLLAAGYAAIRLQTDILDNLEPWVVAAAVAAGLVLIGSWSAILFRNRLIAVVAQAEAVAAGDFSKFADDSGKSRLAALSASLNGLAERIQGDVTKLHADEEKVRSLANRDPLTELPNRRLFDELLDRELASAARYEHGLAVAILDVDHLKDINDSLGHLAGDQLLAEIAARLKKLVRGSDVIARLAGDEFALVMRTSRGRDDVPGTIERLLRACRKPIELESRQIQTSLSAGLSVFPEDGDDAQTLLRAADFALYRAKQEGRNKLGQFDQSMNVLANRRLELEQDLRGGLDRDEFRLFWQPQVSLRDGQIVGLEGLVRWNHPRDGLVMPNDFVALAEDAGLMPRLGYRVLLEACRRSAHWQGLGYRPVPVSVNVSVRQLQAGDFPEVVERVLLLSNLQPSDLILEITESIAAGGEAILPYISQLRDLGVSLAIDDFGTGYSSFSYLLKHRIDTIKIDRSFVAGLPDHADSVVIVKAMVSMARNLGLQVVAEGVETSGQLDFLSECGCEVGQGFLFRPPIPWRELEAFLPEGRLPVESLEPGGPIQAPRLLEFGPGG